MDLVSPRGTARQTQDKLSRIALPESQLLAVIASGAKQSRGRRLGLLDCFAPLAMTVIRVTIHESLLSSPNPCSLGTDCRTVAIWPRPMRSRGSRGMIKLAATSVYVGPNLYARRRAIRLKIDFGRTDAG